MITGGLIGSQSMTALASAAADSSVGGWNSVLGLLLLGAVALILLSRKHGPPRGKRLPPGPRNWPLVGALSEMEPQLHKAFEKLAKRYGPVVHFRLGAQTVVLVSSAEAAEELLKQKDGEFADRSTTMTRLAAKYTALESTGFPWADHTPELKLCRKVFMMEFFTGAKLKSYEELRGWEIGVMVEKILRLGDSGDRGISSSSSSPSSSSGAVVGIRGVALDMTQNVIFKLCMGQRFDDLGPNDEIRRFPDILEEGSKLVMKFNMVDFFPFLEWLDPQGIVRDLKEFEKGFRKFFERILERHREDRKLRASSEMVNSNNEQKSRNLVDVLLDTQEEGGKVSDTDLMGTIATMLMAGIHTIASQVEWVLLELARHPNLLQRLRDEIHGVVGSERPLQEADLQALPFLNAVVLESLRLHPVAPFSFPHVNMEPSTLGGYHIPQKTAVILSIRYIGRDENGWRDPLQFNPDRFMAGKLDPALDPALASKAVSATSGSNYHFLPFGSGRRICAGASLAVTLLLRTVGTLVHAFEWTSLPGGELSTEEDISFVLHPIDELHLAARPRLPRHVYQSTVS